MDDMELVYCTDFIRFGKHDWRIEVRVIGGQKTPLIMFRRIGDTGPWRYPADFSGALPIGLVQFVLKNSVEIGRALS